MGFADAKRDLYAVLLDQIDAAYNFARWALGHPAVAESVIEDVIVEGVRTRTACRGTSARTWVLREVRSAILRQRGSDPAHPFADFIIPSQVVSSIGARAAGMELPQSTVELLRRAVADLCLEQREMVLLRDTEGLAYREIAALTALPQSTIMSRLWQARDALESSLDGPCELTTAHDEALALIDAYIDSEVDISTAATFVQHIAVCPECAQRLLSRSRLVQHIRNVTVCPAPESFRKRMRLRLSSETSGVQSRSNGRA